LFPSTDLRALCAPCGNAIGLAKADPAIELHIVHAHEPRIVYGEIAVYLPEEKAKALQRQHSEDILKPAMEAANAAGVRQATSILIGQVAPSLVDYAESNGCDGIKVIHLTNIPVTLVK
jgi:hypothetical protein